jgi:ATP-binding cassette subfamily F protein uup
MEMAVGKLSGGEQSRLLIAQLMLNPANLLILDEPTNDLDMATLSILEDCLVEFPGAVILVTHDRYFLDQVTTQILAFDTRAESPDQRIQTFSDLFQWESWLKQQSKLEASSPKKQEQVQAQVEQAPATKDPSKRKKLSYKDQRELDSMESVIHDKEKRLAQLTEQSLLPENASRATQLLEITREMESLHHEIDQLYARWVELEAMQLG